MKPKTEAQKRHAPSLRQSQSAKLKKKQRERPKLPPVGERAAQRRRIVLSNTNALAVEGMENWGTENMTDPELIGQVAGLDGALLDQLRDAKAFKRTQNWSLFRRPATLIRNETIAIGKELESVNDGTTAKHLVVGERQSGKSILMLQTMCMAYMNNWIVLNVPEGIMKGFGSKKEH
jgi:small subunit ribosomal protein S29